MIVIGVDPHKKTHTASAVDVAGKEVATVTVPARRRGHERLVTWARELGDDLVFAVEDGRHVSGLLERVLLERGERVLRVPPKLMAGVRRSARTRGKSDPVDARAVAMAALREPGLPEASLPGVERQLRLLVDHREVLVAQRTAIQNRLRWLLHDLDPAFEVPARALDRKVWIQRASACLRRFPDRLEGADRRRAARR